MSRTAETVFIAVINKSNLSAQFQEIVLAYRAHGADHLLVIDYLDFIDTVDRQIHTSARIDFYQAARVATCRHINFALEEMQEIDNVAGVYIPQAIESVSPMLSAAVQLMKSAGKPVVRPVAILAVAS